MISLILRLRRNLAIVDCLVISILFCMFACFTSLAIAACGGSGYGFCVTGDIVPCSPSGCLTYADAIIAYEGPNAEGRQCYEEDDMYQQPAWAKGETETSWTKCGTSDGEYYCSCADADCAYVTYYKPNDDPENHCKLAFVCDNNNLLVKTALQAEGDTCL